VSLVFVSAFAPPRLALAENQPGTPSFHTARTQLTCVATKLQLGEVAVGQTHDRFITITNSGTTSLIVLSAASTRTEFGLNGLDLPLTLAAGESFTFGVTFAPQKGGRVDGSISIISEAPNQTLTIQLSGTGRATGRLQVTPAVIDFGDASVGSTGTQKVQLTARGVDVTVSSATTSSTNLQLGGPSLPFTIPAGHSVPFTVTFVPHDSDGSSAILSFASDAENSPTEQAVTFRMLGPFQHKVHLSWKASTSKHVAGYNLYRGTRRRGPYEKINHSLDPSTNYIDRHVVAGCTYYYVAKAVNLRGQESKFSKHLQVVIPCDPVTTDASWQSAPCPLLTSGVCNP
jgi:Abnormal spindle-like microcephaly-assoc'd, ASPM-SPD-2-Hydin